MGLDRLQCCIDDGTGVSAANTKLQRFMKKQDTEEQKEKEKEKENKAGGMVIDSGEEEKKGEQGEEEGGGGGGGGHKEKLTLALASAQAKRKVLCQQLVNYVA